MLLMDTGAYVAYLDTDDPWHDRMSAAIATVTVPMWTTMPVVTEAMFYLIQCPGGVEDLVTFLDETGTNIAAFSQVDALRRATVLMGKYRDIPMDFADASLVCLADELNVRDILTVDERGFRVFRMQGRKAFHLVLDDFPG